LSIFPRWLKGWGIFPEWLKGREEESVPVEIERPSFRSLRPEFEVVSAVPAYVAGGLTRPRAFEWLTQAIAFRGFVSNRLASHVTPERDFVSLTRPAVADLLPEHWPTTETEQTALDRGRETLARVGRVISRALKLPD